MEDIKIKEFLSVSDGSGFGFGSGSGEGSGSGFRDGSGFGFGEGSGEGSGSGFGFGDGYSYGDGYGYGEGYGYGIKTFDGKTIYHVDGMQTIITAVIGNFAKGFTLGEDLQLTPCFIAKGNNVFAHGATLEAARAALLEKMFDDMTEDERIKAFWQELESGVKYPAKLFYDWHHRLTGSCEFGRNEFARQHGIDIDNDEMTVEEFVELTKNDYGGGIIKRLLDI